MTDTPHTVITKRATARRLVAPAARHVTSSDTALAILDRTIALIDDAGEAALRMHDLSSEVGVAVTSIYHFFGCREGLVEAAHAERYARCLDREVSMFTVAARRCRTRADFEALVRATVERWGSAQHAPTRMTLTSALGASHGRPRLAATIAVTHEHHVAVLGETLRRPQERGWISHQIDLNAFAAWFAALMLQRAALDIGPTRADVRQWSDMSTSATVSLLFAKHPRATLAK